MAEKVTKPKKSSAIPLNAKTLGELNNGNAGAIIDKAIADAIKDTEDRAADDGKKRTVTIQIDFSRENANQIAIELQCALKLPRYATSQTTANLTATNGELGVLFQPSCAENPDQEPLPFDDGDK